MTATKKTSAGLLPYRITDEGVEVFVVHMGGPFWAGRDTGAWSIAKGEYDDSEDPLDAARREFREETGTPPPDGPLLELGEILQESGKRVIAWAVNSDIDADHIQSNNFTIEWPPRSGQMREFPEIDRAAWMPVEVARPKLVKGQQALLDALERHLQ